MKPVIILGLLAISFSAFGQPTVGRIKRSIATPPSPPSEGAPAERPVAPGPRPPAPPAAPGSANAVAPATNKPVVPAARQKTKQEQEQATKKLVDFQKQRALSGSDTAQYDLGVRYLNGDGVPKDLDQARKWLEMSAKQGNPLATQRLKQLESVKKKQE